MPEISYDESVGQTTRLSRLASDASKAELWDEAIAACKALLDHPCAHHQVPADEVWEQIHQLERRAGRFADAIAAKRAAIDAGYRSDPDPETDIAECLLLAGRSVQADQLFGDLRDADPDAVWLYNSAGWAYAHVGNHQEAQRWLRAGIETALRTGDPDQVAPQLLGMLEDSLAAIGEPPDLGLVARVELFGDTWEPTDRPRRWGPPVEDEERTCGYCGFDPERTPAQVTERSRRHRERLLQEEMPEAFARLQAIPYQGAPPERARLGSGPRLAVAWFPAQEWTAAVERWPELLDTNPLGHADYSHQIEARTKRTTRAAGQPIRISPLSVAGLEDFATATGDDPSTAESRASYAADVLAAGLAIPWPPGRNQPCWCGSGLKYKKCCGPTSAAPE